MGLTFLLGPAGSGKTEWILQELRQREREDPLGPPLLYIVPEHMTHDAERALLASGLRGVIRTQVVGLGRLFWWLEGEGRDEPLRPVSPAAVQALLAYFVTRDSSRTDEGVFAGLGPDAPRILREAIDEFRHSRLTARDLEDLYERLGEAEKPTEERENTEAPARGEASPAELLRLREKLRALLRLWQERDRVLGEKFGDYPDRLARLADRLRNSRELLNESMVYVDGFERLSPLEQEVLLLLIGMSREAYVALTLDPEASTLRSDPPAGERSDAPGDPGLLWADAAALYERLRKGAEARGIEVKVKEFRGRPRFLHPDLRRAVECVEGFFGGTKQADGDGETCLRREAHPGAATADPGLRVSAYARPSEEVEAAAQEILRLVGTGAYRFRDIAVYFRDEAYGPLLEATFARHRIPFFQVTRAGVAAHPFFFFLGRLARLSRRRADRETALACLRTELLLPQGMEVARFREAVDRLELLARAYEIRILGAGGELSRRLKQVLAQDERVTEDVNRVVRESLLPILRLRRAFRGRLRVAEGIRLLDAFGEERRFPERFRAWEEEARERGEFERAQVHRQIWRLWRSYADELTLLLGNEELTADEFFHILLAGFEGLTVGLVPPTLDQVHLVLADRGEFADVRVAFVLGMADGSFPRPQVSGSLFDAREREALRAWNVELADDEEEERREVWIAYRTLSRARERLYLSYSLTDGFEARNPSPFLYVLGETADAPEPSAATNPWEVGRASDPLPVGSMPTGALSPRHEILLRRRSLSPPQLSPNLASRLYLEREEGGGLRLSLSASRAEAFYACPYRHFLAYGLRLEENSGPLDAADLGTLLHDFLRRLLRDLSREASEGNPGAAKAELPQADGAEYKPLLAAEAEYERLLAELVDDSPGRYARLRPLLRSEVGRALLVPTLRRIAEIVREERRRSEFAAMYTELPISYELGFLEGVSVRLVLVGRIDRLDVWRPKTEAPREEFVRVIDYKTSKRTFDLPAFAYGTDIQLPAYLLAALHLPHDDNPGSPPSRIRRPAGMVYVPIHRPPSRTDLPPEPSGGDAEADDLYRREFLKNFRWEGRVLRDPEILKAMDRGLADGSAGGRWSPFVPTEIKRSGEVSARSPAFTAEEFDMLVELAKLLLVDAARRSLAGDISPHPIRLGGKDACETCPFRTICPYRHETRLRNVPKVDGEAIFAAFSEASGKGETA
ncbi:PD-(D/E)XK nuclease family protein [Brockia lithotrophica]|uniref:DNA helicase/exodeoxyribonuclease V subunit B n=1 Tax=Brockia lithotrophica TaxID=933949 RepID=A0A660KW87_9BACL|nr:PD-(D/E)XK nuclease family protein [Brockia lithotrophica]RKQ84273.1 DNA helicase/exodeoxyribonuclease V subunit B [Brockia lithotrophica]